MKIFKYALAGFAAGVTLSAAEACTILSFGAENLLSPSQNTIEINFDEVKAFAAGRFPTAPVFTGHDPRFEANLDAPIDLTGFGYAVAHYARGTSGNPTSNQGGSLDFYFIGAGSECEFIFPQTGPGGPFSNGGITSVTLFTSESIPDRGSTALLFAIAAGSFGVVHRLAKH